MNKQLTKIQRHLSLDERKKLFVVITGSKMPRQNNLAGQFFSKYLNVPIESERLIYAEGLTEESAILALVGTWQIESYLASLFFHNANRLKKDLLAQSAQAYLKNCRVDETNQTAFTCSESQKTVAK